MIGIGKANVRYHFHDKRQLFLAAIKLTVLTAQDITIKFLEKSTTPHDQLLATISAAFYWLAKYPDQARVWLLFWSLATRDEEYLDFHHEVRLAGADRLAIILRSFKGRSFNDADAILFARHIQKLISSELVEHLTCKFSGDLEERQKDLIKRLKDELKAQGLLWKIA